jgi:tetratricopeptide (TPR) repeat protein
MASTARIDELKKKFDENPRRYFAPLANEFRKAGDIEQAIMICEEFLPQQPGHMSGHIVYGQALFEAGRFDQSRTVFETALTLDPENLIALRHLGDIAKGQGDLDGARRWYDRVLEADPRNDEIQALIAGLDAMPAGAAPAAPVAHEAGSAESDSAATVEMSTVSREEQRFAPPPAPPARAEQPAPPPLPEPIEFELSGDVSLQMPETIPVQPGLPAASSVPSTHDRAEGLESVEFTPPSGPPDRVHDLGTSLEAGEFTAPASPVAPLEGLEETSIGAFERSVPDGGPPLPMLDTSESAEPPRRGEPAEIPLLEPDAAPAAPARRLEQPADLPPELPPAVIAAEAELLDIDELPPPPAPAYAAPSSVSAPEPIPEPVPEPLSEPVPPAAPAAPFVTETMAELFLKQGFREQALDIYRQLLAANPHDERLQHRVLELRPPAPAPVGDSVRDFLSRLATRRPGEQAAAATPPSNDDFASFEAVPEPVDLVPEPARTATPAEAAAPVARATPSSVMSTGVERGAASQGTGGSIDALFGNRSVGTSEDSAASALAQAFGGGSEPPPTITGRPARAAAGELSLDSVFRDAPPRPPRAAQNFSFDQFFSPESASAERDPAAPAPPAADPTAATEPAERSADDIEQFNSWLQGLKPK